jgi:rubrerythrin
MNKIRINKLVVKGVKKDYEVIFKNSLNIIAGEISTGKSSILELIDYCFGKKDSPQYPELLKKGTAVLLEITVNSEVLTIQRQLFSPRLKEIVHFSAISDLRNDHNTVELSPFQKTNEESISSFILSKIGLQEIRLKEAPTKDMSDVDLLSFRDVLWLCYLRHDRVGGIDLLFEKTPMKQHKLVQVVDVLFNLHSEITVALGKELSFIEKELQDKQRNEKTLLRFAESQEIPTLEELEKQKKNLLEESITKKSRLEETDRIISGSAEFAKDSQEKVLNLQKELQEIRTKTRNDAKTLQRVVPLRAQYYEDISKLEFLNQAKEIVNPISLVLCPVCLSSLDTKENVNLCPLCRKQLHQNSPDISVNVSKEIGTIKRKLGEIDIYIQYLEKEIESDLKNDKDMSEKLVVAGTELDNTLKNFVSPYLSEREDIVGIISANHNEIKHVDGFVKLRTDIQIISEEIIRLKLRQNQIETFLDQERGKALIRTELISALSSTFGEQLKIVNFPKLSDARIDEKLVPYVRGLRYNLLSSDGAINLISICWLTTIFTQSVLRAMHHPGFLIIDSVQSGIGMGKQAKQVETEFQDQKIVEGLYKLLKDVSELDDYCQLIIVDNHPPDYMEDNVIVRFSRDPNKPPYGFIDDETT